MSAILNKDFYKTDHRRQYPEGTDMVYSNFTARSSRLANVLPGQYDEKIVWFGLQAFILDYLIKEFNETFFEVDKDLAVAKYKRYLDTSLGEGAVPVEHIEDLHDLGYLPLLIKSLPEGSRVDIKVPVLTITNTLSKFYWLVNDLETVMSCELWKPTTTATIAHEYYKLLSKYAEATGVDKGFVSLQGHDFSFRGMSGRKDAAISGMGHLLSFVGTDTIPAIGAAEQFYFADVEKELVGCSVPATEHSVMCMGTQDGEVDTFRRLITELYPTGIISIVSDTWDFWKVITEYTVELKEEIMRRQPNALGLNKVVFRPDSGDPVKIISGYLTESNCANHATFGDVVRDVMIEDGDIEAVLVAGVWYACEWEFCKLSNQYWLNVKEDTPLKECEVKGAVECLWEVFGGSLTAKGYKALDEHVGLIYGDSITLERADAILSRLESKGFASSNIVFGIGSYTYQYNTRDSFGFAMKATAGSVNGELREIFKDPVTDSGVKKSAKGLLRVELEEGNYVLYDQQTLEQEEGGELQVVFIDGEAINLQSFSEVRSKVMSVQPHTGE